MLTLGTVEHAIVRASLQRLVELRGKLVVADTTEVVVGLHVFLERLPAVAERVSRPSS